MVKPARIYFCLLFLTMLLTGCYSECSLVQPPQESLGFIITDSNGVNLVTDINSAIHPDSVKLYDSKYRSENIVSKNYEDSEKGYVFFAGIMPDNAGSSILYLDINEEKPDTLLIAYKVVKAKCYTYYEFTDFWHNGKQIYRSGEFGYLTIVR